MTRITSGISVGMTLLSLGIPCGIAVNSAGALELQWIRQFGTPNTDLAVVATDGNGHAYVGGVAGGDLYGTNLGASDAYLAKYNESGEMLWARQFGTEWNDAVVEVAVSKTDRLYTVGYTFGDFDGSGNPDANGNLTAFDADGNNLWDRQIATTAADWVTGVSTDVWGNAYVTGYTEGNLSGENAGGRDAFIAKYDELGERIWIRQFGSQQNDSANDVEVDELGNVYFIGGSSGDLDGVPAESGLGFLTKFDANGNKQWLKRFGLNSEDYGPSDLALDSMGQAYVATNLGGNHPYLLKFDNEGSLLWQREYVFEDGGEGNSIGVSLNGLGRVYVGGHVSRLVMDGGDYYYPDVYLLKYSTTGEFLEKVQFGGADFDVVNGVAADSRGNIFISGNTNGTLAGVNAGNHDAFLARFTEVPEPSSEGLMAVAILAGFIARSPRQKSTERQASSRSGTVNRIVGKHGI